MKRTLVALGLSIFCLGLTGCPQVFDALVNSQNPHSLSASKGKGSSISLSWQAPNFASDDTTTVSKYHIYRDGGELNTTTSTGWTDSAPLAAHQYSYYVTADLVKDGISSTSGRSNSDDGWYVPAVDLPLGTENSPQTTPSSTGWYETLVVKGWTYHFSPSGGTLSWSPENEPWHQTSLGGGTDWTWTPGSTGKVWLYLTGSAILTAWYD